MDKTAQIAGFVRSLANPPKEALEQFIALGKPARLARGEAFCAMGETKHRLGFMHTGLVRYHLITDSGDDVTKDFAAAPGFTVSYSSAVMNVPAQVAVSAVEACDLTVWPFEQVRQLFSSHIEWERLARRLAEWLYIRKEKRELDFLLRSAPERYASAAQELGESFGRIPRHQLAAYLGIQPESLSRLKKKLVEERRKKARQ
ncbi:MAG: Crp/Fnr family transcriptional regulator [Myxococcaceae bacterium]